MKINLPQFVAIALATVVATLTGCASSGTNAPLGPQPWAGQAYQSPSDGTGQPTAISYGNGPFVPAANHAENPVYRGQNPEWGGRAVNPLSPQEQSQPTAPPPTYLKANYPPDGSQPAFAQAPATAYPAQPQPAYGPAAPIYGPGSPAAPAAYGQPVYGPAAGTVPAPTTSMIPPTYPPAANINGGSPGAQSFQQYPPQSFGPDGIRTAYAGPPPPPGLYDPMQRGYPGDLLTPEGQTNPLMNVPFLDLDTYENETQTGKLMFGVGVNSDSGLVGQIVLDEQNFDWTRWPSSWEDVRNGTAWRGAGQRFRIEAMPGIQVQRYLVSFTEPYLLDSPVSLNLSASYFTRIYTDWTEQRAGGRVGLGYLFTPDLSGNFSFRGEHVDLRNPTVPTPPELQAALGGSDLFGFGYALAHDTRDSSFLPTEGHFISAGFEEVTGTFTYPRVNVDARQYYTLTERPDGSGRHILGFTGRMGWSGDDTPIYEHYFAGGSSSLRGFQFRGVGPRQQNVEVGGDFELIGSVEYLFPITADDMLRGVFFTDFGTVEQNISLNADSFRASVGFGLRIAIPAMGQAPIALDFAVPVHMLHNSDEVQNFSFTVGFNR